MLHSVFTEFSSCRQGKSVSGILQQMQTSIYNGIVSLICEHFACYCLSPLFDASVSISSKYFIGLCVDSEKSGNCFCVESASNFQKLSFEYGNAGNFFIHHTLPICGGKYFQMLVSCTG